MLSRNRGRRCSEVANGRDRAGRVDCCAPRCLPEPRSMPRSSPRLRKEVALPRAMRRSMPMRARFSAGVLGEACDPLASERSSPGALSDDQRWRGLGAALAGAVAAQAPGGRGPRGLEGPSALGLPGGEDALELPPTILVLGGGGRRHGALWDISHSYPGTVFGGEANAATSPALCWSRQDRPGAGLFLVRIRLRRRPEKDRQPVIPAPAMPLWVRRLKPYRRRAAHGGQEPAFAEAPQYPLQTLAPHRATVVRECRPSA